MNVEVTSFCNLPVYTSQGTYVGVVQNVALDLPRRVIGSLLLTRTNTDLVEGGHNIAVPYRWVASKDDIVILNNFPAKIIAAVEEEEETEEELVA